MPRSLSRIPTIAEMRAATAGWRHRGRSVGLVPTMGFMHHGHLELMRRIRPLCDELVVSIFVNPSQFGRGEDLSAYPRDLERDAALCAEVGVDHLFLPSADEVYPAEFDTWIHPGAADSLACGPWRPGHFRGVLTVVHQIFQWVRPEVSIFGRKDAQQLWLIRRMAEDLGLNHRIEEGPLVRDPDGLAMSSRNIYLTEDDRAAALEIHRCLKRLGVALIAGEDPQKARDAQWAILEDHRLREAQYLELIDWHTFRPLSPGQPLPKRLAILAAAKVGKARLLDNVFVENGKAILL